MNFKEILHPAKVIKNNDLSDHKDKKAQGRVQIKIDYLMSGFNPDHYPWVRPFSLGSGGSAAFGDSSVPEINSMVWVFFLEEEYLRQGYYIADVQLTDINPHTFFTDNVKSAISSASEYPNTKYKSYKNKITTFVDSSDGNPELGFYHPKGTYFLVDKNGKTLLNSKDELILSSGGGGSEESSILGETLKEKLEALIDEIKLITVPTGIGPSGVPINASKFDLLKNDLIDILSEKTKNN